MILDDVFRGQLAPEVLARLNQEIDRVDDVAENNLVFRPNGNASGNNVFKDFRELEQKAQSVPGQKIIYFVDDGAPINIPGEVFNMNDCLWRMGARGGGVGVTAFPKLIFLADGCKLNGLRTIESQGAPNVIISLSSSPVIDDWLDVGPPEPFQCRGDAIFFQSTTAPMFHLTGTTFVVFQIENAISGFFDAGSPVIDIDAGAGMQFWGVDAGTLRPETITGSGTVVIGGQATPAWGIGPTGAPGISTTHSGFTGAWVTGQPQGIPNFDPVTDFSSALDYGVLAVADTSAPVAITLPTADRHPGASIMVKDAIGTGASTNNITITPDGSETIDGAANKVISTDRASCVLVSDGASNWMVVAEK